MAGATSLRSDLALDTLEQAISERRPNADARLVHHSDRGAQYLAIRYTARLLDAGIEPSVGSRGDSYDNALAECVIGSFKTEVIHRRGPWRGLATLEWVWWFQSSSAARTARRSPRQNLRSTFTEPPSGKPRRSHSRNELSEIPGTPHSAVHPVLPVFPVWQLPP